MVNYLFVKKLHRYRPSNIRKLQKKNDSIQSKYRRTLEASKEI